MALVYDRFLKQRLSRRRLLGAAGGTAIGAAGIALIGCGSDGGGGTSNGSTPDANETPTIGGIYRTRQSNAFPSLSPFGPTALASALTFAFTTYDHLWYVPIDTGRPEAMLATKDSMEAIDPDGTEFLFTLHPAVFHDKAPVNGRAVEAQDVVESWKAFRDDPFGLGREWLKNIMDVLEAQDASTLHLTQKQKWAWMFGTAGAGSPPSSNILPRETITNGDLLRSDLIGSGRYFLESHRGGENLKFRAFPNWRIEGEPWLGGVDFVYITDYGQAEAQFISGGIDNHTFQNKLQADDVLSRLGDEIVVTPELARSYHCLMLNLDRVPAFQDVRVRKAFRLAINREEMIQAVELDPEGGVLSCIVPPAQKLYALEEDDADFQEYVRFDPDEARALLEQADFPFDQEITILISSPNEELSDRAQVLKSQLEKVGVKTKIEQQDLLSVWVPRVLLNADYEMTLFTHLPYEDPYLPLAFYTTKSPIGPVDPEKGRNSMYFYDAEVDAAVEAASAELELEPQIEKVKAAQKKIMEKEGPMINIYSSVDFNARRSWLKGVVTGRGSFGLFNGRVWIDSSMRGN
jgi:ABC-type transport system substrate-binding protein